MSIFGTPTGGDTAMLTIQPDGRIGWVTSTTVDNFTDEPIGTPFTVTPRG